MNTKDITNEFLEKIFPIGSYYQVTLISNVNLENAKKSLPKIGEWEYVGLNYISFIFKRIK